MKWFLYAFLSTSIYAFIPILDKINCSTLDPIILATSSSLLSSCFLILYCIMSRKFNNPLLYEITYLDFVYIVGVAILAAISWAFYYGAVKFGPISKITTLDSIGFVLTIIFSAFILKETIAVQTIFGIVMILFGMLVVIN